MGEYKTTVDIMIGRCVYSFQKRKSFFELRPIIYRLFAMKGVKSYEIKIITVLEWIAPYPIKSRKGLHK